MITSGMPEPRHATLANFVDAEGGQIDEGLVVSMPGPNSYTGEDSLELYLHGGIAVVEHALEALLAIPNVRLAEPGEFTRRAFENGRLDLTQAEGVADLIDAESRGQKTQALEQLGGSLTQIYEDWRHQLIKILALLEASIDFPDEDEAPEDASRPVIKMIDALTSNMETSLLDGRLGERIRDGFRIAIIGRPNAGKSTLLNRLAQREAAIVTPVPGTTRDVVEIRLRLGGQLVWIADTAGIRDTSDEIEAEGVRRAEDAASRADIRLFLTEGRDSRLALKGAGYRDGTDLSVVNKIDVDAPSPDILADCAISAKTGEGVDHLEALLVERLTHMGRGSASPIITRARHRTRLEAGAAHLNAARELLMDDHSPELAAEDVRLALREIGAVVGAVGVEDILGSVFADFCIGK
jgi:tRNA modification GTPase